MQAEDLQALDQEQLRNQARELGVSLVKGESADNLRVRVYLAMNPQALEQFKTTVSTKPVEVVNAVGQVIDSSFATPLEIEEYVQSLKECTPHLDDPENGLRLRIQGDCWFVRCRGTEDSGNIKQPLAIIKQKIETVSRGALRPVKITSDGGEMAGALSA